MTLDRQRALWRQSLGELEAARSHLRFSAQRVAQLPVSLSGVSEAQLESAEAFTSRFARVVDLLVNKVLRCLDALELRPEGTLLDVVHAAEQRGFVASADVLREMKGVRNTIAHDYAGAQLPEVFAFCRRFYAELEVICDRVIAYAAALAVRH
jgi:uncharacterized protein YutE (UPF0331/DUF86 family)